MLAMITAAPDATIEQTKLYSLQLAKILSDIPEIEHLFQVEDSLDSFRVRRPRTQALG